MSENERAQDAVTPVTQADGGFTDPGFAGSYNYTSPFENVDPSAPDPALDPALDPNMYPSPEEDYTTDFGGF